MDVFTNLMLDEPENAILMPMESEMPTVTTVRIKAIMTGALSTFFETKEDFAHDQIPEDSVLHQAKLAGKKVRFSGDHIWLDMFGSYFDSEKHYNSFNVRDLDTNDINVRRDVLELLKENDFDLLVCHFIGIDHAGHTFYANHTEIERKVKETQEIIEEIIQALDDDTVLLLYGDHGMTNDGNHGGGT
jgi:phosphatidylinositol glycan class O